MAGIGREVKTKYTLRLNLKTDLGNNLSLFFCALGECFNKKKFLIICKGKSKYLFAFVTLLWYNFSYGYSSNN